MAGSSSPARWSPGLAPPPCSWCHGRLATGVAATTGVVGIVLLVVAGHAAALPGLAPLASQTIHVAAAAIWIGGVMGLLALASRPGWLTTGAPPSMRRAVPRFSALALVSVGLVGLTGVYNAWLQTGALVTTDTRYGLTLILKTTLAIAALAVGALNYLDGGRMMGWLRGLRTRLRVESLLALLVLVMAAVLAITPPVEDAAGVAIGPVPDAFGEVVPGMSMTIVPGRPGVNRVVVTTKEVAEGANGLELGLDRVDTGTTTRVPLLVEGMAGMEMEGMEDDGAATGGGEGTIDWSADAVLLPAASGWDSSVRILGNDATELSRQRFAFTMGGGGVEEGRINPLLTPATVIALLLVVGGGLGVGLGVGGMALPRGEAVASRIALVGGGTIATLLGALIGVSRLIA